MRFPSLLVPCAVLGLALLAPAVEAAATRSRPNVPFIAIDSWRVRVTMPQHLKHYGYRTLTTGKVPASLSRRSRLLGAHLSAQESGTGGLQIDLRLTPRRLPLPG